ncbi:MAG: hypothetical protein HY927_16790 [Elusimicrobia bacterium]|nr:hypothetical protein [Elusimicrobiota bacterium]
MKGVPLLALALLAGCSFWSLRLGTREDGEVVEARGKDLPEARRNAVGSLLGLYVSSRSMADSKAVLDEKILARAAEFVKRCKILRKDGGVVVARVLVALPKLSEEVDRLGLAGGGGGLKILLAIDEEAGKACRLCPASAGVVSEKGSVTETCRDAGCASDSLRRALIRRGFAALDLSDRTNPLLAGAGRTADPLGVARLVGADILVRGAARADPVSDERLKGYHVCRAKASLSASRLAPSPAGGERPAPPGDAGGEAGSPAALADVSLDGEATAVDMGEAGAATKALENVGEILGDSLATRMAVLWRVDAEIPVVIVGMKEIADVKRIIEDARRLPDVRAVSLARFLPPEARLRVRTGRPGDELAAQFLGMKAYGFSALAVGTDLVELEMLKVPSDEDKWF